jgi:hypothetical protein
MKSVDHQPDLAIDGSISVWIHSAKAGQQPGQRPFARAALPVHAAQQRRRELRHRGEADEPDADQRIGLARQVVVQVAQQQDGDDGRAPDASSSRVRSPCVFMWRARSSSGITRSLQTIVETAIASTMTMPVAADSPPMKASSASQPGPGASGRLSTKVSGSAPPLPKCSSPPSAIGSTNRLIASR